MNTEQRLETLVRAAWFGKLTMSDFLITLTPIRGVYTEQSECAQGRL